MDVQRIERVEGTALPMRGDDIDTDRIIPARYLRSVTFEGLDAYVFEDDRAAAAREGTPHPFDTPRYQGASLLFVNRNFGCGSSREHAPQALHRWGIRAVVGESFSDIFFGNSMMIGLPCVTASASDLRALLERAEQQPETIFTLDLHTMTCAAAGLTCPVTLPAHARDALVTGAWDTTGLLVERYEEVDAVAARLPYVANFR